MLNLRLCYRLGNIPRAHNLNMDEKNASCVKHWVIATHCCRQNYWQQKQQTALEVRFVGDAREKY
ncbi:hypothetical protein B0D95_14065 [Cellvibrio sp. PSBB023]|nr:hypothetical protein B0D95_14065 [Cellvibrio sp. PSBB023]